MELEPIPVRLAAFHVFFAFSPSHVNCAWREMCTTFFFGGARTRNTAVLRRECTMEDMSLVAISPEPSKAYNTMTVMLGKRLSIRDDVVRLSRVNCPYPLGARSRNPSHFGSFHGEIPNGIMRPFPSAAHYWQTIIDLSQDPNHSPCRMGWHILALSPASPALTPVLGVSMTFVQTQVLHLTCP